MSQTNVTIYDGFYSLLQENNHSSSKIEGETSVRSVETDNNLYNRIAPIIPKNFSIAVNDTHLEGVRENNRTDFKSALETISVSWQFTTMGDHQFLPNAFFSFLLADLRVENTRDQLILLNSINLNAKVIIFARTIKLKR